MTKKFLTVMLTMDWEGTDLYEHNLRAIQKFNDRFKLPWVHYLSAGYYTNPNIRSKKNISGLIWSVIKREDAQGLHLHTPKHFVDACHLSEKHGPHFSSSHKETGILRGQDLMLMSYQLDEIKTMIEMSRHILSHEGFNKLTSFRAGGWMASEEMLGLLKQMNFKYDSSATPASILKNTCWENENLERYISLLWEDIQVNSTPYYCDTPNGDFLEVPNNLGAIDYWNEDKQRIFLEESLISTHRKGEHLININSHQESAYKHLPKLYRFLEMLEELCHREGIELSYSNEPKEYGHEEQRTSLYA